MWGNGPRGVWKQAGREPFYNKEPRRCETRFRYLLDRIYIANELVEDNKDNMERV
jgi:hypothetical protein